MQATTPFIRCLLLGLLFASGPVAGADDTAGLGASLDGLLHYAREHSPVLNGARLDAEAARERAGAAGALPDPRLRIEWMDITRGETRNASLLPGRVGSTRYSLMQDLPWPGKRGLERDIAAAEATAAGDSASATWSALATAIRTRQLQRWFLVRDAGVLAEMAALLASLEHTAQARYANGLAAQQDVIRAQLEQTGVRNQQIALAGEQRRLEAELNTLLGRPAREPLLEPAGIAPLPPVDALDFARLAGRVDAGNPRLQADSALSRAAGHARDRVRRERYPDFSLGLSPVQYDQSIREWELMLELNIPLQRRARRARERESEARLARAEARLSDTRQELLGELDARLAALASARRTLELLEGSLLPQAELTLVAARAGYEAGQVDFSTLLDAQKQILQARLDQHQADLAARLELAEIDRLAGVAP